MSKIAKALEKSMQTRGDAPEAAAAPAAAEPCALKPAKADDLRHLIYTHSKVVKLDHDHLEQNRIAAFLGDQDALDNFNILRTQILQRTREKCWNSIMVTSPAAGDGKTLTAINLAISIAREVQQTALLVDTNLRSPRISEYLGVKADHGLSDYLAGHASIEELLINPGIDKLVLLPCGNVGPGTSELLGSPRMRNLVRELKTRYPERYVIYDCPHLVRMPDSQVFSEFVDCMLMVVRANKTQRESISEAMRLIQGRGFLGTVLNDFN